MQHSIRWYDAEKTILLCEVMEQWTWDDAYVSITKMNEMTATVSHGVYSVFQFHKSAVWPKGSAIPNVKRLIAIEHPNDQLAIFVASNSLVQMIVGIASKVYRLNRIVDKFCFVGTLDDALKLIERHKLQVNPSVK